MSFKTFKHIFTSPSSVHDISALDQDDQTENVPPPKTCRTVTAKKNSHKAVAANLRMTCVTPRAIAYAAVQVSSTGYDSNVNLFIEYTAGSCTF